jgi:hypothetical protein
VVIARCLGAPEDLLGHGRCGTIVEAEAGAMAAGIASAIRDPQDRTPLIARAHDFSSERCLDRYEAMVDGLLRMPGMSLALAQGRSAT